MAHDAIIFLYSVSVILFWTTQERLSFTFSLKTDTEKWLMSREYIYCIWRELELSILSSSCVHAMLFTEWSGTLLTDGGEAVTVLPGLYNPLSHLGVGPQMTYLFSAILGGLICRTWVIRGHHTNGSFTEAHGTVPTPQATSNKHHPCHYKFISLYSIGKKIRVLKRD